MDKDLKELVEAMVAQGWRVEIASTNHVKAFSPDGVTIANIAATPSDWRWRENALRDLRRGGFDVAAFKGRKRKKGGR